MTKQTSSSLTCTFNLKDMVKLYTSRRDPDTERLKQAVAEHNASCEQCRRISDVLDIVFNKSRFIELLCQDIETESHGDMFYALLKRELKRFDEEVLNKSPGGIEITHEEQELIEAGDRFWELSDLLKAHIRKTPTKYGDHFFIDDDDNIVGIECGSNIYKLGDLVEVTDDGRGYIGPGITTEGYGRIVDFVADYSDHYFGVRMDNGEYSHLKLARIAAVC